ncbi:spaetzle domain-containing protein [Cochliomyia hominivorax]
MAHFLTLFSVLLIVAVFNPIVCPSSQLQSERRDRAPYIESNDNSQQNVGNTYGPLGSRLRKTSNNKEHNTNHRNQEQLPPPPSLQQPHNPPDSNKDAKTDSLIDDRIRMVFATDFEPGVHLFNNTAPYLHQSHFSSYSDQMVGDQPGPHIPSSSSSSNSEPSPSDKEFFKVQRSPNGNLSVVFKKDLVPKSEKEANKNLTTDSPNSSSKSETFENRFQTHFPTGLPLEKDKLESSASTVTPKRNKDGVIHFPTEEPEHKDFHHGIIDSKDCLDKDVSADRKPFCNNLRNYPEKDQLNQLIREKFSYLEPFFNEDLLVPQNISQRMDTKVEEFLCGTRKSVIHPEAGVNNAFDWFVIINTKDFKQGIIIEECTNEQETCGEANGLTVPNRYRAICQQQFVFRTLFGYRNATIIKEAFKFPSCCKCVLESG